MKKKKERICLKCGKEFDSDGNSNRICKDCKIINSRIYTTQVDIYDVGL